jgi:hypothetical protein
LINELDKNIAVNLKTMNRDGCQMHGTLDVLSKQP